MNERMNRESKWKYIVNCLLLWCAKLFNIEVESASVIYENKYLVTLLPLLFPFLFSSPLSLMMIISITYINIWDFYGRLWTIGNQFCCYFLNCFRTFLKVTEIQGRINCSFIWVLSNIHSSQVANKWYLLNKTASCKHIG